MAGVVEEGEVGGLPAEDDLGQRGVVRFDAEQAVEVEAEDVAQVRLDDAAMRHHEQVSIEVSRPDLLEGAHRPLLK